MKRWTHPADGGMQQDDEALPDNPRRLSYAQLLSRVFEQDISQEKSEKLSWGLRLRALGEHLSLEEFCSNSCAERTHPCHPSEVFSLPQQNPSRPSAKMNPSLSNPVLCYTPTMYKLHLTQARLKAQARLHHVLHCISHLHYPGTAVVEWSGDDTTGSFYFDDLSGDRIVLAWNAAGLVGLAFDHESERSQYGEDECTPLKWLGELPTTLRSLAEGAAEDLEDLVTAGLWVADEAAHLSDEISGDTVSAHGLERFLRFGMEPREAVFGETGQNWGELSSLNPDQLELALSLAECCEANPRRITPTDASIMLASPEVGGRSEVTLTAAEESRALLAQLGIEWDVPTDDIRGLQHAKDDHRQHRVSAHLSTSTEALFEAARNGSLDGVEACLLDGADINARTIEDQFEHTPQGDTPLLQAIKAGHTECGVALIKAGAAHEAANSHGQTALYWAAVKGDGGIARKLLDLGADPNKVPTDGVSCLHAAAGEGFEDIVEGLLKHGADRLFQRWNGQTPADLAELRGHTALAARLRR
ncbi:MAG: ankyrin repeat domain-containing protein [Deltaproteobacteria bacterium]|nr:ankyrin repeat domain-containing protein [Deltaproteobacteria bacterium]